MNNPNETDAIKYNEDQYIQALEIFENNPHVCKHLLELTGTNFEIGSEAWNKMAENMFKSYKQDIETKALIIAERASGAADN